MQEAIQRESGRINVALKFVDWFAGRGQAYEHNLRIIDKHLKDLVTSDTTSRVHSYYLPGNRVQFTSTGGLASDVGNGKVLPDATMQVVPPDSSGISGGEGDSDYYNYHNTNYHNTNTSPHYHDYPFLHENES